MYLRGLGPWLLLGGSNPKIIFGGLAENENGAVEHIKFRVK